MDPLLLIRSFAINEILCYRWDPSNTFCHPCSIWNLRNVSSVSSIFSQIFLYFPFWRMLFYGAWELLQLECQTTSGKCRHFQRCLILCDSMKTADLLFVSETKHCQRHNGGLSSGYQSNFFWSYHKFSYKSWSDFIFKILTKQLLQDLNQISAFRLYTLTSKSWPNVAWESRPRIIFITSIKDQQQNAD